MLNCVEEAIELCAAQNLHLAADVSMLRAQKYWRSDLGIHEPTFPFDELVSKKDEVEAKDGKSGKRLRGLGEKLRQVFPLDIATYSLTTAATRTLKNTGLVLI